MALARAYLRDAQLLILDEPTAALDARSEHEVFARFAELTEGKMSVLISHRFSTVRMADRILVLKNGTIAEQGPHLIEVVVPSVYSGLRLRALPHALRALDVLPRPVAKAVTRRIYP